MNQGAGKIPLAQRRPTHVYFKSQSRALHLNRQRPTPPWAGSQYSNTQQAEPGLELDQAGISDPVTPESSISGRKCRRLRVALCRLNTALSSEHRWVGGALSSRGCRWPLSRREGTCAGGGCLDVKGMRKVSPDPQWRGLWRRGGPQGMSLLQTIRKESGQAKQAINY